MSLTEDILNDKDIINSILFDCQCCLFLLDMTNKDSLTKLQKLANDISFEEFSYLKIILVENKIDKNKEINEEEIDEFLDEIKSKEKMQISIKNGTGIEELSNKIKEYVNNNKNDIPINFSSQNINEYKDEEKEKENLKKTTNIIFLGNSMVGKSSLFSRIDKNHFKECFMSSIGMDRIAKSFKYKKDIYKVNLWDTAGQDRFRNNIPRKFYINAHGVFLLFDLCDQESFNDISIWMNEINQNCNSGNQNGPVIFLIGNKLDKLERVITREQAEDKASFYGVKYFEISCKLNINIQEVYSRMVLECTKNIKDNLEQSTFKIKPKVKKNKSKKKNCCDI
jgi:small GTP-binding protein